MEVVESGMTERDGPETAGGAALWARYRAGLAPAAQPDALTLAAYAENRLGPEESEAVEAWLARHPDSIEQVLAARAAAAGPLPLGRRDEVAAARALVAHRGGRVVPQLLRGIGWGSVAAGLMAACLISYEAGVATEGHNDLVLSSLAHEMGFVAEGNEGLVYAMGGGDASEEL